MAPILNFKQMDAWNVAMDVAVAAYGLALKLPAIERFGLASQIRRSASSIPANVAEGHCSGTNGRYLHHVRIALGSAGELVTHFELARRLRYLTDEELEAAEQQWTRETQLLHGLSRSLKLRVTATGIACLALFLGSALGYFTLAGLR